MRWMLMVAGFFLTGLASPATVFYSGDFDGFGGEGHTGPGSVNSIYYENFELSSPTRIHTLFGNHIITPQQQVFVEWRLRVGMSEGNGGMTLASSSSTLATVVPTGRFFIPLPQFLEYSLRVEGLDILLGPGSYWLAVRPLQDAVLTMTDGINGIGPTVGDHRSIGHGQFNMYNYKVLNVDWSYGVEGTPIPEPATMATIGFGVALVVARGRRRARQSESALDLAGS